MKKLKAFVLNPNFLILIILIVAAFMRLYRIEDYMTFLGDEGRDVLVAYNILHGKLTLLGPAASVGGFFLGPVYYYLITPFLWLFSYNPVGPAVMVALFGVATVYLVYKFAGEFFGSRVGLMSAFLYSISPLVIAYSRSSWNPNIVPFFSLACIYLVYEAVRKKSNLLFLFTGLILGISLQLHYLVFFLGSIVAAYILIVNLARFFLERPKNVFIDFIKENLLIFGGFLVGLSPFLAFEARHGLGNIRSIFNFIFNSSEAGAGFNFFSNIYDVFFRLFARLITGYPPSEQIAAGQHQNVAMWHISSLILGLISFSLIVYLLKKAWVNSKEKNQLSSEFIKLCLVLIWLVFGIFLFGFYRKPIYDYYFGFMFVLPFILTANALNFFASKSRIYKILAAGIFILLVGINLTGIPFRHEPNRQQKQVREIAELVLEKADGKPFNFALITGGNSDHAYRYFFTINNQAPIPLLHPGIDPKRKSITDQLLVICEGPCEPLGNSLWEVAGFGRAEIAGEWDIIPGKIYKLVHYKE